MSAATEIYCPHCQKRYRIPTEKLGRQVLCKNCNQKFVAEVSQAPPLPGSPAASIKSTTAQTTPEQASAGQANAGQAFIQQPVTEASWCLADSQGQTYENLSWNDLLDFAMQSRLTAEMLLFHPTQTQNQWVAVGQFSELTNLFPNAEVPGFPSNDRMPFKPAVPEKTFKKISIDTIKVPILVSAISNVSISMFWIGLVCGIPFGIACIALCVFEFVVHERAKKAGRKKLKSWTLIIGICEVLVGLCNPISLVCGIIVLIQRVRL